MDSRERRDSSSDVASDCSIVDFNISTGRYTSQDSDSDSESSAVSMGDKTCNPLEGVKRSPKKLLTKRKRDEGKKSLSSRVIKTLLDGEGSTTTDDVCLMTSNKKVQTLKRKQEGNNAGAMAKKTKTPTTIRNDMSSTAPPTMNIPALLRSKEKAGVGGRGLKDVEAVDINTVKGVRRVRQVRRKVPLLNEAQVVRAVRAALNEQPIIILPIFLGQEQQEWYFVWGICAQNFGLSVLDCVPVNHQIAPQNWVLNVAIL